MTDLVHVYNPDHQVIKMSIKDMLELPIENWKYNRPPDEIRSIEIANYFNKFNVDILQAFYIHYRPDTDAYEMLDGIHRYTGLKMMNNLELMYDKIIFIHLFTDLTDGILIDIFQNLNKTVPVPSLYIHVDKKDDTEKVIVEDITKQWITKYKSHFSPNSECNIPNINRDTFIILLTDLYNLYKIRTKDKLEDILEKANILIKEHVQSGLHTRYMPNKFSNKQKDKCLKSDCYLFLYRPDKIKEIIDYSISTKCII